MADSPAPIASPYVHARAELIQQKYLDDVTDVLGRRTCTAIVGAVLHHARGVRALAFVATVEVSRMRRIGQVHGQGAVDSILRQAAERIQQALDLDASVARLGDASFLVATAVSARETAADIGAALLDIFRAPFPVDGVELLLNGSVGYELCAAYDSDPDPLIRRASIAADRSRRRGGRAALCYNGQMGRTESSLFGLEQELARALRDDELTLHYQPQVCSGTGRLVGCEALVRWPRSDGEAIPPSTFLDAAQSAGLLGALGTLVLRHACADIAVWRDRGLAVSRIAVNVAPVQFLDPEFPAQVMQAVAGAGLGPEAIELELTERGILDDVEAAYRSVMALHDRGIRMVLDDFGTGQSSLTMLHRFPFAAVKIDRSFVAGMYADAKADRIVRAIIALAGELGMAVVGEGVETADQRDRLAGYACGALQGYLFGRPMPADALAERWFGEHAAA